MRTLENMPGDKPKYLGAKEETLTCETCKNSWTRISRRGRKPRFCPACLSKAQEAKAEAKRISAQQTNGDTGDRMALARAAKAQRQQERAQEQREQDRERIERMARTLPNVNLMWNRAFTIALEQNTEAAWNHCDILMNSYVSTKRVISA